MLEPFFKAEEFFPPHHHTGCTGALLCALILAIKAEYEAFSGGFGLNVVNKTWAGYEKQSSSDFSGLVLELKIKLF